MNEIERDYRVEEELSDGRVVIVQLAKADANANSDLEANHYSRSVLFCKFLMPDRELNERELACFTNSDFFHQVALFAGIEEEGRLLPLGAAQYVRNNRPETSSTAEFTIGVGDPFRNSGIEAILLRHLIKLAKNEGLASLTTGFPSDCRLMFDALREINQSVISVYASGVFSLLLPLTDAA